MRAIVRALNELLASVRQNVDAQKRFIADAAHQLRTPLAGLISQTELALAGNRDPALSARLTLVHTSATRASHLINQLLSMARADPEAAMVRERAPVDLVKLARDVLAEMVPQALNADIDLEMLEPDQEAGSTAPQPVLMSANELLLREALVNVLDNAIQYAGRGAEVVVSIVRHGPHATLRIADNGLGIPLAQQASVFERFVRATHEGDGCGLGLAIVREIVQQHGGDVNLESAEPHGLVVNIALPVHVAGTSR